MQPKSTSMLPARAGYGLAWRLVADGVVAGCPAPTTVTVGPEGVVANVYVRDGGDVAAWAGFLGLPGPEVNSFVPKGKPYRLTVTTVCADAHGVSWFVDHYQRDPLTDSTDGGGGALVGAGDVPGGSGRR